MRQSHQQTAKLKKYSRYHKENRSQNENDPHHRLHRDLRGVEHLMLELAALGRKHKVAQNSSRRLLELPEVVQQLLQFLHIRLAVQTDVLEVDIQKGVNVEAELVTEIHQLGKQLLVLSRLSWVAQVIILEQILLGDYNLASTNRIATTPITQRMSLHNGKQIAVQLRIRSSHLFDDRVDQQNKTVPLVNVDKQFAHTRFVVVLKGMIPESQHEPIVLVRRYRIEVLHSDLHVIWRLKPHDGFEDRTSHSIERVVAVCVCGIKVRIGGETTMKHCVGANHDDVFLVAEIGPLILECHRLVCDVQNEDRIHVVGIALIHVSLSAKELSSRLQRCLQDE